MLNRKVALDFLTTVLWALMSNTNTTSGHTQEQARGIILDVEGDLKTNKVQAIKTLHDWVNNKEKIVLPNGLGKVSDAAHHLLDSKHFIDVMESVLKQTEPKAF